METHGNEDTERNETMKQYRPVEVSIIWLEEKDVFTDSALGLGGGYYDDDNNVVYYNTPTYD